MSFFSQLWRCIYFIICRCDIILITTELSSTTTTPSCRYHLLYRFFVPLELLLSLSCWILSKSSSFLELLGD